MAQLTAMAMLQESRLLRGFFQIFSLLVCMVPSGPPAVAGVAIVDENGVGAVFLREGPWLFRARCEAGVRTPDTATCNGDRQRVEALDAYRALDKLVTSGLPALDEDIAMTEARVLEVDVRFTSYLSDAVSTPDMTRLRAEIAAAQAELTSFAATLRNLREQIARIESRPTTIGTMPPDLPQQLVVLRRQEAETASSLATAATRLDELRSELLSIQVVSQSQAAFDLLQMQRQRHLDRVRQLRLEAGQILERRGRLAQFLAEIVDDQGFVFEVTPDAPFASEVQFLDANFVRAQKKAGVMVSVTDTPNLRSELNQHYFDFSEHPDDYDVERDRRRFRSELVWMACSFPPRYEPWGFEECNIRLLWHEDGPRASPWRSVDHPGLSFTVSNEDITGEVGDFITRLGDLSGDWRMRLICDGNPVVFPKDMGRCEARYRHVPR